VFVWCSGLYFWVVLIVLGFIYFLCVLIVGFFGLVCLLFFCGV